MSVIPPQITICLEVEFRNMIQCSQCGEIFEPKGSLYCEHCDQFYCEDHIARKTHQCSIQEPLATSRGQDKQVSGREAMYRSSSTGRLIAGAILIVGGGMISLTGIGLFIGVPMGLLGFGVMFPRITLLMAILAAVALVLLLLWVVESDTPNRGSLHMNFASK